MRCLCPLRDEVDREKAIALLRRIEINSPLWLTISPEKRTDAMNSRMWAMLADVARQVCWHGQRLAPTDWKHIFTAALEQQRVAPGLNGGFVVLGQSTRRQSKAWFSELFELIEAFGADPAHPVRFSAPDYYGDGYGRQEE